MTEQRTPDGWEKKKQYNLKYAREKYKRIPLDVSLQFYEEIKTAADLENKPVNRFIKDCIEDHIKSKK